MKEILFETDAYQISYEENYKLLTLIWKRYINSNELKDAYYKIIETIKTKGVKLYLADNRLEGTVHPDDRKWVETEVIPTAVKNGLKFVATILDANVFQKYYLSKLKDTSQNSGMSGFKIFGNYDEGRKWILEQEI